MLQKQQAQVEDETSPIHPRNMQKLNRELELVGKEYRCVKRYQDPMRESLVRCLEKRTRPSATHSMSTLAVPTTIDVMIPHHEQREAAHKHHHLKTIALRRSVSCTQNTTESPALPFPWNATAFLERMFNHN
jgi:hypothetical protein